MPGVDTSVPTTTGAVATAIRPRVSDRRGSFAVFVAVMLACFSLHVLLDGAGWWFELMLVCAFVVGSAALSRELTRRRAVPSVVAGVVLLAFVIVRFAADTTILGVFPSGATVGRFVALVNGATESISSQSIPVTVDAGILLFLVAGVGFIALVTDLVATTLRAPAFAGIPLLVLLAVPGMTDFDLSDGFAFVLAVAGYLWLLLAGREHRRLRLSTFVGAVAIVGALVVSAILPPFAASGNGDGGLVSTGLDPTIDLGDDLRATANTPVLVYTTESGKSQYLRLVTLEKFSGTAWVPDPPKRNPLNTVQDFAAPTGLSAQVATSTQTTVVSVGNFRSPWLPLPYPTSSVSGLRGDWYWESGSLAVSSSDASVQGQNYETTSVVIRPTPRQLSAAGDVVPSGFSKYLSLPGKLPAIISDTARQVTADEQGNYAKAVALQQYFRSDDFVYSVQAPVDDGYDGTGMAVIAKFLEEKSGYCIHFASAMAVMARSLGIPARVAVGFQPGTVFDTDGQGRNIYRVTSHDLHAWPELYFDGIGWVPFEPTPGRGDVPSYADLSVPGVPAPISQSQSTPAPTASATPAPGQGGRLVRPGDPGGGGAAASQSLSGWIWAASVFLLLVLILLTPAVMRSASRSARLRAATASGAWREVVVTAEDVGLRLPGTMTPREAALALAPAAGGDSLDRLRAAVERESYAPGDPPQVDAADVRAVTARLVASVALRERLLARLAPPSAWRRILRVFVRTD